MRRGRGAALANPKNAGHGLTAAPRRSLRSMSTPYKAPGGEGKSAAEELQRVHRIRITLTSKNVANLEKGAPPWRAGRGPPPSRFIAPLPANP